jgi:hypothetical protein
MLVDVVVLPAGRQRLVEAVAVRGVVERHLEADARRAPDRLGRRGEGLLVGVLTEPDGRLQRAQGAADPPVGPAQLVLGHLGGHRHDDLVALARWSNCRSSTGAPLRRTASTSAGVRVRWRPRWISTVAVSSLLADGRDHGHRPAGAGRRPSVYVGAPRRTMSRATAGSLALACASVSAPPGGASMRAGRPRTS